MTPILHLGNRSSIESFAGLFSKYDVVDGTELPPLECCGITLDGLSKSGKSAAISGNERLIILKCYDGAPIVPRCRAKIIVVRDLKELRKVNDDLRLLIRKLGKDSFYKQVAYDPIATIVRWLAMEAVEKQNREKCFDTDGNVIPAMRKKLIDTPDGITVYGRYGPWNHIATIIQNMMIDWAELGCGWIAPIHYQWKVNTEEDAGGKPSGMVYRPNIPQTTADRLDLISDVAITTERSSADSGDSVFTIRYTASVTKRIGSRIPLTGFCECPNYNDSDTPPGITTWDYIHRDFMEACKDFTRDSSRFAAAWAAIKKKAGVTE